MSADGTPIRAESPDSKNRSKRKSSIKKERAAHLSMMNALGMTAKEFALVNLSVDPQSSESPGPILRTSSPNPQEFTAPKRSTSIISKNDLQSALLLQDRLPLGTVNIQSPGDLIF